MRILITGAGGMLARAVRRELEGGGYDVVALGRADLDVTDPDAVYEVVGELRPEIVFQGAAYTNVDRAEADEETAWQVNARATTYLARACRSLGARLVYPSTDYVFDGRATTPYRPDHPTAPLGAYGRSKLAGEEAAREAGDCLVVRTSWLFGEGGRNFVDTIIERAREGEPLRVVDDQRGAPTWTGELARVIVGLIASRAEKGVYHAVNRGEATWYELAREALRLVGVETMIDPVKSAEFPRPAPRPPYSVLDCTTTEAVVGPISDWRAALREYLTSTAPTQRRGSREPHR